MWPLRSASANTDMGAAHFFAASRDLGPRTHPLIPDARDARLPSGVVIAFGLAGMSYNAVLAIVNAHVMPLAMAHVAIAEFVLLSALALAVLRTGLRRNDIAPVFLGALFVLGALTLSFVNGTLIVTALRNAAIIVLFTMLGHRCDARTIRLFGIAAIAVVAVVMLYELLAMKSYAALFQPQQYYLNTRGIGEDAVDDTGLFPNALGFDGRFSYGLFQTPRTSSIFLEQTSLANFASVTAIFLLAQWRALRTPARIFLAAFVLVALLSNNTRMSSTFALIALAGYAIFPRLPSRATLALPLLLLAMSVALTLVMGPSKNDDLAGRIGMSVHLLALTDLRAALGARAMEADAFPDSGYSYVLYSSSIVGTLCLWLYVALIIPFRSDEQRRCAWGLSVFFFINLLVAGNAVFAMKIAAPLWLLAGHMRSSHFRAAVTAPARRAIRPIRSPIASTAGATT
jgi:hypothetical protein